MIYSKRGSDGWEGVVKIKEDLYHYYFDSTYRTVRLSFARRQRGIVVSYFNGDFLSGHRFFHFAVHERVVYPQSAKYRESL